MKRYKIVECTTNYGRKFYAIKYTVTILYFITYWELYDDDNGNAIEFNTIKDAERKIKSFIENDKIKSEKVVSCTSIK